MNKLGVLACAMFIAAACSAKSAAPRTTQSPPSDVPAHPYLVITRRAGRSVRIIELPEGKGSDLEIGATTLGATSDGTAAYLTAPDAGELAIVSGWPATVRIVKGLKVPHDAAAAHGVVAVTEEGANDLAMIDAASGTIASRIALPGRPHNVVVTPHGFLVTLPNRRSFATVDLHNKVREFPVGERPHACQPAGDIVWCVTYDAPHLLKISGGVVSKHITLGVYPHHLTYAEGVLYVSDLNGGKIYAIGSDGSVASSVRDPRAGHVLRRGDEVDAVSERGSVYRYRGTEPIGTWTVGGQPHGIALID